MPSFFSLEEGRVDSDNERRLDSNALYSVHLSVQLWRKKMKTIAFTDFRKNASRLITEVEHGETIVLLRRGKPIAEVVPFSNTARQTPSWKDPGICLEIQGSDLSSAILEEREL